MLHAEDRHDAVRGFFKLLPVLLLVPLIRKLRRQEEVPPRRHVPIVGH